MIFKQSIRFMNLFPMLLLVIVITGLASPLYAKPQQIYSLPTKEKVVALTFDDRPRPGFTERLASILSNEGVTATFFLVGNGVKGYPAQARYLRDSGFAICNHSNAHPKMVELSDVKIIAEAQAAGDTVKNVLGINMRPFFRPPYGSYNDRVGNALEKAGYNKIFMWNIDTRDWSLDTTANDIIQRVKKGLKPGAIIIMHLGCENTIQALPAVIKYIKSKGYTFTDIPTFFGKPQPQQHLPGLTDVHRFSWYYEPVKALVEKGIISGYGDGTFRPQKTINRAELATMLMKAKGIAPESAYRGLFCDVRGDFWAWPYIEAMAVRGLISSNSGIGFGPFELVTKQEVARLAELIANRQDSRQAIEPTSTAPSQVISYTETPTADNTGTYNFIPAPKSSQLATRADVASIIYKTFLCP